MKISANWKAKTARERVTARLTHAMRLEQNKPGSIKDTTMLRAMVTAVAA